MLDLFELPLLAIYLPFENLGLRQRAGVKNFRLSEAPNTKIKIFCPGQVSKI